MYNKLFTDILDSSIWMEPNGTRIVWLTCIAAMDEDGFVRCASVLNLAHRARVSVEEAEIAIEKLEGADPYSSDSEHEGRRLERVPGGWIVLNAKKYNEIGSRETMKAQSKARQQRFREQKKERNGDVTESNGDVTPHNATVTHRHKNVTPSDTDSDTTTDTETEKKKSRLQAAPKKRVRKKQQLPKPIDEAFLSEMQADPRYVSLDVQACYVKCERWNEDRNQFPSRASFRTWLDKELEFKRQGQQRNGTPTKSNRDSRVGASPPPPPKCGKPARFSYTWPDCEPAVCCEECIQNVKGSAGAMGLVVKISELTGEPQICP